MQEEMERALSQCTGEYADVRYERDRITQIEYSGRDLSGASECEREGFHLRALKGGGLGSYSLNEPFGLVTAMRRAEEAAALCGRYNTPPTRFKYGPAAVEEIAIEAAEDPRAVPLDEKVSLLRSYRDIVLSVPRIQTANLIYTEWAKTKVFANTRGSRLRMEEVISSIHGEILAREGDRIENVRVEVGGGVDFSLMRSREEVFESRARLAAELLSAQPVPAGSHRVLLNPGMVGVFIHEAFGHFSEADIVKDNPSLLERLRLNQRIAVDELSVVDDPTLRNKPGFKLFDDEGVRCSPTQLIRQGVLAGRLHSMQTAAQLDEELTGNAVAVGCSYPPLVRMSNIFVEPGRHGFDDLMGMLGDGLYICDPKGGSTMGDQFAFGAQHGYVVRRGKISQMVSGITISGNLFQTMLDIKAVGNDVAFRESGSCGKGSQMNPQSGLGGPHVLIDPVVIG